MIEQIMNKRTASIITSLVIDISFILFQQKLNVMLMFTIQLHSFHQFRVYFLVHSPHLYRILLLVIQNNQWLLIILYQKRLLFTDQYILYNFDLFQLLTNTSNIQIIFQFLNSLLIQLLIIRLDTEYRQKPVMNTNRYLILRSKLTYQFILEFIKQHLVIITDYHIVLFPIVFLFLHLLFRPFKSIQFVTNRQIKLPLVVEIDKHIKTEIKWRPQSSY